MNQTRDKLLTVQDIMDLTKLSRRYIYELIDDGKIPAYRLGNIKAVRVKESDLWRFIESRRTEAI